MKKILCLISILILVFAVVSCNKKKKDELPDYEEQVSKEIKAEEGGKVESSDGKTSVDIPAGALDEDTTITMTIYNAEGYEGTEGKKVISKVVNFEPNGTIFKKPVIITMAAGENVKDKTIVAAVYDEKGEKWSYSQGFYVILDGKTEAGDPIMHTTDGKEVTVVDGNLTAAGDPIMMTNAAGDPIMTNAAGDPIMMSAAGDPIMLASAGDPIMSTAAGDPIMNSAAGDPIMMTTGHFTTYLFAEFDPREKEEEEPDEEPVDDSDTVEPDDDPDTASPDEDVIPEPDPVYSKVVCTGQRTCGDDKGKMIDCPQEGGALYGQDANYAVRGACVPQNFEKLQADPAAELSYPPVKDNNTGLTWLVTGIVAPWTEENPEIVPVSEYCGTVEYDGGGWRLPTPKELLTIADADINTNFFAMRAGYFPSTDRYDGSGEYWSSDETYYYETRRGRLVAVYGTEAYGRDIVCVKGEEFGKTNSFISKTVDGEETIFDETTNLMWQRESASGKTWEEALSYCENSTYAGYTDWRLPNKNEMATLIDYSKAGGSVVSSFPGMEAEVFVTSTLFSSRVWTGNMYMLGSVPWRVDMADGNGAEPTFSVRCVRSDLDSAPADGIFECDPKIGYAPCKDSANDIIWSSRVMFDSDYVSIENAAKGCRELSSNGSKQWRLPTIDELRTLVTPDEIKKGGTCEVTKNCINAEDCFDEAKCTVDGEYAIESKLRDYGRLLSGTPVEIENADAGDYNYNSLWLINTSYGAISYDSSFNGVESVVRCVLDKSIPNEYPYTQELDAGKTLVWSEMSDSIVDWSGAAKYCKNLEEGSFNNWRVPTLDEVQRLVNCQNCGPNDNVVPNYLGGYSVLGDIDTVWTSEVNQESSSPFMFVDFVSVRTFSQSDTYYARVRCIRDENEEEVVTFPKEVGDYIWSEISPDMVRSMEEAEAYCAGLEQLSGYMAWTLPDKWDIANIIDPTYCEMTDSTDIECSYSFEGYSVFGDMVTFVTSTYDDSAASTLYYHFDFASGANEWPYVYGYVRCVALRSQDGGE